jgi:zinc dependent phospholipase C
MSPRFSLGCHSTRASRRIPALFWSFALSVFLVAILLPIPPSAFAWDSRTHKLITRLAVQALPPSPLSQTFTHNELQLEEYSIDPDTVLRSLYGEAEARRHYIDLEYFGAFPFASLEPNFATMETKVGVRTMTMSGTLPWTIEAYANQAGSAWRKGDCAAMLRYSGYMAHYVGDSTQPLHTTKYYDGHASDRGVHQRFEGAADRYVREIEPLARPQVRVETIDSVWTPVIAEIRDAYQLAPTVISSDRAVRAELGGSRYGYDRALMDRDLTMVARQVARSSSTLASIWLFEWRNVDSPMSCTGR